MITLTEKDFDENGFFINKSYFNADNDRYEFLDNLEIDAKRSIFGKSIFVRGYQVVQGNQIVQGNQVVRGYQDVRGYQVVQGNQLVQGNQDVRGDQDVRGYQDVRGDQVVQGFKLLKSKGIISINFIGSRKSATKFLFTRDNGIMVKCGCFFNTIDIFKNRVIEVHKDNQHSAEYLNAIEYAVKMYDYYKQLEAGE